MSDIVDGVEFECPFCGRLARAGTDADGESGVDHEEPTCARFDELDPIEFLQAARVRLSD